MDLQVLSLGSYVPYLSVEADAVSAARVGNDAYAAIAREHLGRLGAFGSVPLPHLDAAIAEASTLAALRLLLSGLVDRNPEVRIIVPHFGGTLPVIYPRIARRGKANLLRKLYYDTANGYGPAPRCACEALGPDTTAVAAPRAI